MTTQQLEQRAAGQPARRRLDRLAGQTQSRPLHLHDARHADARSLIGVAGTQIGHTQAALDERIHTPVMDIATGVTAVQHDHNPIRSITTRVPLRPLMADTRADLTQHRHVRRETPKLQPGMRSHERIKETQVMLTACASKGLVQRLRAVRRIKHRSVQQHDHGATRTGPQARRTARDRPLQHPSCSKLN